MSMGGTAPEQLLHSVHMEKSHLGNAGGNCYRRQTVQQSKVDPEVSELPRDHVSRPQGYEGLTV